MSAAPSTRGRSRTRTATEPAKRGRLSRARRAKLDGLGFVCRAEMLFAQLMSR